MRLALAHQSKNLQKGVIYLRCRLDVEKNMNSFLPLMKESQLCQNFYPHTGQWTWNCSKKAKRPIRIWITLW
jgi:hypothetical protein